MSEEITYRRLKDTALLPDAVNLVARFYGPGFFLEEDAVPFLENRVGHYAFGAFSEDGTLVGLGLGKTLDSERMGYYNRLLGDLLGNDLVLDFLDAHSAALNALIVDEEIVKNNKEKAEEIARELAELVMEKLSQISNLVFADVWHSAGEDFYSETRRILEGMQFKKFRTIKNFWTSYTERMPEAVCPICGNPCYCSAVVFYKKIQNS